MVKENIMRISKKLVMLSESGKIYSDIKKKNMEYTP